MLNMRRDYAFPLWLIGRLTTLDTPGIDTFFEDYVFDDSSNHREALRLFRAIKDIQPNGAVPWWQDGAADPYARGTGPRVLWDGAGRSDVGARGRRKRTRSRARSASASHSTGCWRRRGNSL